jgi:hypothetical protein
LAAAAFIAGCATATGESQGRVGYDFSKLEKVAVIDVTGAVMGDAAKNQIGDFLVLELLKKGYAPVERSQVQALLKEQKFQESGITFTDDAAKAGRILNVPAVILVSIPDYKDEMSITAKMVGVEDGAILWQGTGYGRQGKMLATIFGAAAGAGAGAAGGHAVGDRGGAVVGGIAGAVLGGAAGQALTPQQAEQVQKIVKEMCKQMPSRVSTGK